MAWAQFLDADIMNTPKQFLESFFQERAAAYAVANVGLRSIHAQYFGEPLLQHAGDFLMPERVQEVVESVKLANDSALIITQRATKGAVVFHTRYLLLTDGESWKIVRIEWQCFMCHGTGQHAAVVCPTCGGEGWYDNRKNAT